MSDPVQHFEFAKLALQEGNDRCVECQSLKANFVSVTFGVFLCQNCAEVLRQGSNLNIKNIDQEQFSRIEMGIIREGGNLAFKQYMTQRFPGSMETRYTGKEAEFYQRKLAAEASGQEFLEEAPDNGIPHTQSISDGLTDAIRTVLTWSEMHVNEVLEKINKKVTANPIAKVTCQVLDASTKVYEAQVREHLISPHGFFHPVKRQMDRWGNFMDPPGLTSEAEMENLCPEESSEQAKEFYPKLEDAEVQEKR